VLSLFSTSFTALTLFPLACGRVCRVLPRTSPQSTTGREKRNQAEKVNGKTEKKWYLHIKLEGVRWYKN